MNGKKNLIIIQVKCRNNAHRRRRVAREEYYMCHLVCGIIKTTTIVRHWVSRQKSSPKNSFSMSLGSMCNPILSKVFAMRSASRWILRIDSSRVLRPMYILIFHSNMTTRHTFLYVLSKKYFHAPECICLRSLVLLYFEFKNTLQNTFLNT